MFSLVVLVHEYLKAATFVGFLLVCAAPAVWGWLVWLRFPPKHPLSRWRSSIAFVSLCTGTLSTLVFIVLTPYVVLLLPRVETPALKIVVYSAFGLACLSLLLSAFAKGQLRIAELILGFMVGSLWWQMSVAIRDIPHLFDALAAFAGP